MDGGILSSAIEFLYAVLAIMSITILIAQSGYLRLPRCPNEEEEKIGSISVVIPVRNERENIRRLVEGIHGPGIEIIIVDDESTDGSYEEALKICSDYENCKAIRVSKPSDWMGKPYACYMGYLESSGEYIVFLDSDTVLSTKDIYCLVKHLKSFDIVSGVPRFKCRNLLSSLVEFAFNILVSMFYPPWRVGEGGKPWLAGAVMAWRREAYDKVGGHKRVYNTVVEDAELGRIAYQEGLKISFIRGGWYTIWRPSYRDLENFFTRIMMFIKIGRKEALLLIAVSLTINIAIYLLPIMIFLGYLTLIEGLGFLISIWSVPILQILSGVVKPRVYSIVLYPIGFLLVGWLLYVAWRKTQNKIVINWRGREIIIGGHI
jgi:cellulose synthase/poly-beta-1,6-N-acetylglucosamine synthase-like glycosyltransferase